VTNGGMVALLSNAALVRKVAFPRETLVFAQVLHGLVQFGIEMSLLSVVLLIFGSSLLPWFPMTMLLMLLLAAFASGIALALAAIGVYFRDMAYLWSILSQMWFFATPIVYSGNLLNDTVPKWARELLQLNPIAQFSEGFRRTMYHARPPGLVATLSLTATAAISLGLGSIIFAGLSRRFAEEL